MALKIGSKTLKQRSLALLVILFLGIVSIKTGVFAQTVTELKSKIESHAQTIADLEKEIASYQKQLEGLRSQKDSLNAQIKELDLTTKKLYKEISLTEEKIKGKNEEIKDLGVAINEKSESIDNEKEGLAESVRYIREIDDKTLIETMLDTNSIGDVWRSIGYTHQFQESLKENTVALGVAKQGFETNKSKAETARKELEVLKNELADQKKIVDGTIKDKSKLLSQTKSQESNYTTLVQSRLAQKDALEKEVRDFESQLKFVLDPKSIPTAGHGVFSWPLDKVIITQYFGRTVAAQRLYASGSHNGVDMGTSIGTPVRAMADGVVAGTGDTDAQCPGVSFGRFVLIKYDNGLASTYGHLSLIKVRQGDHVERGEIVGYSGNTGYSTGPHLHVSVYARDSVDLKTLPSKSCKGKVLTQPIAAINGYLDPMVYLPVYKK